MFKWSEVITYQYLDNAIISTQLLVHAISLAFLLCFFVNLIFKFVNLTFVKFIAKYRAYYFYYKDFFPLI